MGQGVLATVRAGRSGFQNNGKKNQTKRVGIRGDMQVKSTSLRFYVDSNNFIR